MVRNLGPELSAALSQLTERVNESDDTTSADRKSAQFDLPRAVHVWLCFAALNTLRRGAFHLTRVPSRSFTRS
jgi:hypothetical protein